MLDKYDYTRWGTYFTLPFITWSGLYPGVSFFRCFVNPAESSPKIPPESNPVLTRNHTRLKTKNRECLFWSPAEIRALSHIFENK